jgi:hypothetical protein
MSGHYRKEKNCLNCGHHVEFHYCSSCGQPNLELKEPFWHFMGHSIAHYFHFESKFWQTLLPLLTKPGQLTLDYLAGKRARYIHPVSLYIFISIIYFLIVPHALEEHEEAETKAHTISSAVHQREKQNTKILQAKKELSKNEKQMNAVLPGLGAALNNIIKPKELLTDDEFEELPYTEQKFYLDSLKKSDPKKRPERFDIKIAEYTEINTIRNDSTYSAYLSRQKALPAADRDDWIEQKLKRLDYGISGKTKNHNVVNEEFKKYQPKQYFLLMPLLAFFIMINFRKNKIYYINHLVFTIHGMTAFFIVSILTQPIKKYVFGLDSAVSGLITTIVFCGIVWYLYKGLKLFYNRSRNQTIRKTISLMILYSIALAISEMLIKAFIMYLLP